MANWKRKIRLTPFITDSDDHEVLVESMTGIGEILSKDPLFEEIGKEMIECEDLDYFNDLLEEVYNIADRNLVWIETIQ